VDVFWHPRGRAIAVLVWSSSGRAIGSPAVRSVGPQCWALECGVKSPLATVAGRIVGVGLR